MPTRILAPAAICCLLFAPEASGQSKVLDPHQVATLTSVGSARISPDGRHIAYTLSVPREPGVDEDGRARTELHLLDVASGESRAYVTGEGGAGSIRWTAGGKGLSFLAKRDGDEGTSLYVIAVDGGEARRAVGLDRSISSYSFSPDGSEVALIATEKESEELEKLKKKGFDQEIYEEDWHPRQILIAVAFDEDAEPRVLEVEGSAFAIAWSPVDYRLAVALTPTPLVDDSYMARKIHVLDTQSGESIATFEHQGKLGAMHWSPEGSRIAFLAANDLNDPTAGRLKVASSEGGPLVDLFPGIEGDVDEVRWADDEKLLYLMSRGTRTVFGSTRFDGTEDGPIFERAGLHLRTLTVTEDGMAASFVGDSATHPSEVFAMKHGDSEPTRMTDSNSGLADVRFATQEVITYEARDGLSLEGILIRPMEEREGERYPLIVVVHGGPESHYNDGWLTNYSSGGQVAAGQGFAVFYPNYRGSTGRGVRFAKASQGDPAGAEFDDLIDGVDHLIEMGLVDGDRVGVTGGSYGGYATAWCATRYSERFAAGVMFVGISDKVSKAGTTDIPGEIYLVHDRKYPWDDWQFSLERSPIFHAENCETPLLILHGKKDTRVDPGQSRELYRHVKLRTDTPVRLVHYPGEGHGNRNAAARLDYNLRLMRWMNTFLVEGAEELPDYELNYDDPAKEEEEPVEAGFAGD